MKKIAIYGQAYTVTAVKEIKELLRILIKNNVDFFFEKRFYNLVEKKIKLEGSHKTFEHFTDLTSDFDAMITIGGDGTFLRSVTYVRNLNIPIVGINTGRLGFLATIQRENIESAILSLLAKDYKTEERSLLVVETSQGAKKFKELNFALNEITLARKNTTSMIGIKTHLNGEYLNDYWADGLIISTPTGSTGYSLSCNGPVLLPKCKSLIINPIAPHNLSARPIVINDDMVIELEVSSRENKFLLSLDSRITAMPLSTKMKISKSDFTIKTVLFNNQSFLKTLRTKLLWGNDVRNESK